MAKLTNHLRLTRVETVTPARGESADEVTSLFRQHSPGLMGYVRALGLSAHDSEDIVQETFLALFSHLENGRPRDNLRGWIFRVGHNLALKRRQRQTVVFAEPEQHPADPAMNPEQQADWRMRQQRLQAVLKALPERDRYCLHLRAAGLRYREIADVTGMSLGNVALTLGRVLRRLGTVEQL